MADVGVGDTGADAGSDAAMFDAGMVDSGVIDAEVADVPADLGPTLPLVLEPSSTAPANPLADSTVESCSVYQASRCEDGVRSTCRPYDVESETFVEPTGMFERALLFDRWYDLYQQPQGQTATRNFGGFVAAGTPEAEWSDPENFRNYESLEDAAIWNGAASVAATMRYLETGTDADYERMERKVRDHLLQFDVTGIPGYLARYHFLNLDESAPNHPDYLLGHLPDPTEDYRNRPFDPSGVPDLPAHYTEGVTIDGVVYEGQPMFRGHPSIDQYTGPRIGFSLAYDLLRDDSLKERITTHLTCYLKRLQRIEIRNLQENPEASMALQSFLNEGEPRLDDGDIDLSAIDTIVIYGHPNINTLNEDTYDRSCADSIDLVADRVLDASADTFLLDMITLAGDFDTRRNERRNGFDHLYAPSVRGADAVHLMHLAAFAFYATGEEQYRRFLQRSLVQQLDAIGVALTTGAVSPNQFCKKYYANHITFSPMWAFLRQLGDSELRSRIEEVMEVELWEKEMFNQANLKFNAMYVGELGDAALGADQATAELLAGFEVLGGNGGVLSDPRRYYPADPAELLMSLEADHGIGLRCPTPEELAQCEDPTSLLGVSIPGTTIGFECTGDARECPLADGRCALGQADAPLPYEARDWKTVLWNHSPWNFRYSLPEWRMWTSQSAGLDVTEPYWLSRHYGIVTEGRGQVLAWETSGDACE